MDVGSPLFFLDTFFLLYEWIAFMAPFWFALGLGYVLFRIWVYYVRAKFLSERNYVLLEMKLPQEISKTPAAMELVLDALHQTGKEGTWYDRLVKGQTRANFSLELVSLEGQVKFFIRTRTDMRHTIETQIYSQYPTVEIYEVPDYTSEVHYGREDSDWTVFGAAFKLTKANAFPIKTYIDYGLDKVGVDEEFKIDPMTPMLEYLGAIGPGQQAWYQILIRANKGKKDKTSHWGYDWEQEMKDEITKLVEEEVEGPDGKKVTQRKSLTSGEKKQVDALEKSAQKRAFDCGMRAIYVAKKDNFTPANIPGLFGVVKQYSAPDLNGFAPDGVTDTDYPWQDYKGKRVDGIKKSLFDAYRRRSWFFLPYEKKPFMLNTEELATMYHFPGGVAETPTFGRIESKKAEPPINLPV